MTRMSWHAAPSVRFKINAEDIDLVRNEYPGDYDTSSPSYVLVNEHNADPACFVLSIEEVRWQLIWSLVPDLSEQRPS